MEWKRLSIWMQAIGLSFWLCFFYFFIFFPFALLYAVCADSIAFGAHNNRPAMANALVDLWCDKIGVEEFDRPNGFEFECVRKRQKATDRPQT